MADRPHRGGGGGGGNRGNYRGRGGGDRGGRGGRGGDHHHGGKNNDQQGERERPKKENILDLAKYMDKEVQVKFNGGREGEKNEKNNNLVFEKDILTHLCVRLQSLEL